MHSSIAALGDLDLDLWRMRRGCGASSPALPCSRSSAKPGARSGVLCEGGVGHSPLAVLLMGWNFHDPRKLASAAHQQAQKPQRCRELFMAAVRCGWSAWSSGPAAARIKIEGGVLQDD